MGITVHATVWFGYYLPDSEGWDEGLHGEMPDWMADGDDWEDAVEEAAGLVSHWDDPALGFSGLPREGSYQEGERAVAEWSARPEVAAAREAYYRRRHELLGSFGVEIASVGFGSFQGHGVALAGTVSNVYSDDPRPVEDLAHGMDEVPDARDRLVAWFEAVGIKVPEGPPRWLVGSYYSG